jgi:hypothetical protein
MKIAIESDLVIPPVSKAISILTDRAKVCVKDIHYDETKGIVDIYRGDLRTHVRSEL